MTNIFKICQLCFFTLSLVILFSITIVIAQEGLLYGKIKWSGIVHGDSIEVNYRWSKEVWHSDTEKDYSFNGT